jgi:hypothetical protein
MDGSRKSFMVTKIVSGGQTGADRAALDVALDLGFPHGGWVPKGRNTERGPLPGRFSLQEMGTASYSQRTEQNVIDSDGTLLVSHGELFAGSLLTQALAKKHRKPCLHIDLESMEASTAADVVINWLDARDIKVLNVAGSHASKDSKIYEATRNLLLEVIRASLPHTVEEAIERLIADLPLKDKTAIANMDEGQLPVLAPTLTAGVKNKFGLSSWNGPLLGSCRRLLRSSSIDGDRASALIVKELWKKLQETHVLRVVK